AGDIITAQATKGGVDIFWAANDGGTIGAVMAVKNAGLSGKTFVFGTDAGEQQLEMLKSSDNILQAVTGQDPYMIGYKTMEVLIKDIKGEDTGFEKGKTQIQDGILLSRTDSAGLDSFEESLKKFK
ncbi:MAG: substrate-binding domain-containing protein, partial [Proteocatella sp.]